MKTFLLTPALALVALLLSPTSRAQTYIGVAVQIGPLTVNCRDAAGTLVRNFEMPMAQAAMSTVAFGGPAIFISSGQLQSLPIQFAVFTYAHECAHQSLGHVLMYGKIPSHAMEFGADCRAAADVRKAGWLLPHQFDMAMKVLYTFPGSTTHPPGPARVANAWNCYNSAV